MPNYQRIEEITSDLEDEVEQAEQTLANARDQWNAGEPQDFPVCLADYEDLTNPSEVASLREDLNNAQGDVDEAVSELEYAVQYLNEVSGHLDEAIGYLDQILEAIEEDYEPEEGDVVKINGAALDRLWEVVAIVDCGSAFGLRVVLAANEDTTVEPRLAKAEDLTFVEN